MQWGRLSNDMFSSIFDRVEARMQSWKGSMLNFSGRTTLLKSAIDPISNHIMNSMKLPAGIIKRIDRFRRHFLWKDIKNKNKSHSVGWENICRPIDCGGLGIRDLTKNNLALLGKLAWRVNKDTDSIVFKIFRAKYFSNSTWWDCGIKPRSSHT